MRLTPNLQPSLKPHKQNKVYISKIHNMGEELGASWTNKTHKALKMSKRFASELVQDYDNGSLVVAAITEGEFIEYGSLHNTGGEYLVFVPKE